MENSLINANPFYQDVIYGLYQNPKRLPGKFIFHNEGLKNPETNNYFDECKLPGEAKAYSDHEFQLAIMILQFNEPFSIVEFGATNNSGVTHLLKILVKSDATFCYVPVNVDCKVIEDLEATLPFEIPGLAVYGFVGDFSGIVKALPLISRRKIIILPCEYLRNQTKEEAIEFLKTLRKELSSGDMVIARFDLAKALPSVVDNSINDDIHIKQLSIKLLERINGELHANFDTAYFDTHLEYQEDTGTLVNYLLVLNDNDIQLNGVTIAFKKGEKVYLDVTSRYSEEESSDLALTAGFLPIVSLPDQHKKFADGVWITAEVNSFNEIYE